MLGVLKLGAYWAAYTWLPSYLASELKQGIGKSFAWVLSAQVGQLAGMLTFGWVADRVGRRLAFCLFALIIALSNGCLALFYQYLSGAWLQ